MSPLAPCIYCHSAAPPRRSREHVIPQSFGTFANNWVLNCVCDGCNEYFGQKLELILGRDSSEALLRLRFGLKPPQGALDLLNRRTIFTIETPGPWYGARAFLAPDRTGARIEPVPLPQVGFKRPLEVGFTWLSESALTDSALARYRSSGTEYRIVGPTPEDLERLESILVTLGLPSRQRSYSESSIAAEGGSITFAAESTLDRILQRAIAKIGFNYAAYVLGASFARQPTFDQLRQFVRSGTSTDYPAFMPSRSPILSDRRLNSRPTRGHLLVVEWGDRAQTYPKVRVSLFNEITYDIRLCRLYAGLWRDIAAGHLFDPFSRKISSLRHTKLVTP